MSNSITNNSNESVKDRWIFTKEQLNNTPSIRKGLSSQEELCRRQSAANLIQDVGQKLHCAQLCINTAIVYMHRFYMFHSFQKFPFASIATCSLFLAAKVEESPRKLEFIIKTASVISSPSTQVDPKSKAYMHLAQELVANENLLLQTLGFEMRLDHPHTSVITCCQLVRASIDLTRLAYNFATNSLHLTTLCLRYRPSIVACVCIHMACKWSKVEIPKSVEDKNWWLYVDDSVTYELIDELAKEFILIIEKSPKRLRLVGDSNPSSSSSSTASSGSSASSISCGSGSGAVTSGNVIKKIKLEK